jgi:hypothetical protein
MLAVVDPGLRPVDLLLRRCRRCPPPSGCGRASRPDCTGHGRESSDPGATLHRDPRISTRRRDADAKPHQQLTVRARIPRATARPELRRPGRPGLRPGIIDPRPADVPAVRSDVPPVADRPAARAPADPAGRPVRPVLSVQPCSVYRQASASPFAGRVGGFSLLRRSNLPPNPFDTRNSAHFPRPLPPSRHDSHTDRPAGRDGRLSTGSAPSIYLDGVVFSSHCLNVRGDAAKLMESPAHDNPF